MTYMMVLSVIYTICVFFILKSPNIWRFNKFIWLSMVPVLWWATFTGV